MRVSNSRMVARYLIRFDDVCPTMNWPVWKEVEKLLLQFGVKPILAVVAENKDPNLNVGEPNARFWDEVRAWQMRGWTIGLHGYQHLHATQSGGILKLTPWSEFSGLALHEQKSKLLRARDIFEREGITPRVWIAPGHSFDATTLQALRDVGIQHISDGFSLYPHQDASGMIWVPQQLWHFRQMPLGVWTICLHFNRWGLMDVDAFRSNLHEFAPLLSDWDCVVSRYQRRRRSLIDIMFARAFPAAVNARRWLRHLNASNGRNH